MESRQNFIRILEVSMTLKMYRYYLKIGKKI